MILWEISIQISTYGKSSHVIHVNLLFSADSNAIIIIAKSSVKQT